MILNNVTTITGNGPTNIQLSNGHVSPSASGTAAGALVLEMDGALAFRGLINWHDHLDFNLFPQLGDRIYDNYTQWGNYIHAHYKSEIAAVLKVPADLRTSWGIFKNLLCGVTTVVNHGEQLPIKNSPITIGQGHSIHSVQFEKQWKLKLNNLFKRHLPAMVHIGEGKDELASKEIDQLNRWNLLGKKLIGIHGIAMTTEQAKNFEALVWCPESNYFLFDQTANVDHLKKHTRILFGTDSTLTADWNIWEHIRLARKTGMLRDAELYDSISMSANHIEDNGSIVVTKRKADTDVFDTYFDTDPDDILLVVHQGQIRLFDASLFDQLKQLDISGFSRIEINGSCKYVEGDLPTLIKQIKTYYPEAAFPISAD